MRPILLFIAALVALASPSMSLASPLMLQPQVLNLGKIAEGKKAHGDLTVRNTGSIPLTITNIQTSCGCTTGTLDTQLLPPGGFTQLHVTIDTFAKRGPVKKRVWVSDGEGDTASAELRLTVLPNPHLRIPGRSIFKGSCMKCHYTPALNLHDGAHIYTAVCAMCHGNHAQGGYAPALRGQLDRSDFMQIISTGDGDQHMPGFAMGRGGPLDPGQIRALSNWLASLPR